MNTILTIALGSNTTLMQPELLYPSILREVSPEEFIVKEDSTGQIALVLCTKEEAWADAHAKLNKVEEVLVSATAHAALHKYKCHDTLKEMTALPGVIRNGCKNITVLRQMPDLLKALTMLVTGLRPDDLMAEIGKLETTIADMSVHEKKLQATIESQQQLIKQLTTISPCQGHYYPS